MTAPAAEPRTSVETRALRMLAAGDDIKSVSQATGLTKDELDKLRRDFPSTKAPKQSECAWAACHEPATVRAGAWEFCGKHAVADAAAQTDTPASQATGPTISRLLEDASGHSVAKVRRLAGRIETQLDQLRALIAEHAAAEQERRAAAAARAQAQARVKQLEEELRAAKAALKGGSTPAPSKPASGKPAARTCEVCGQPVVREPGRPGPTPKVCAACKAAA